MRLSQKRTCEGCAAIRNAAAVCELGFNNRGSRNDKHFGYEIKPQEPCLKPRTTREFIEAANLAQVGKGESTMTKSCAAPTERCQKCWEHEEREAAVCPEDVGCIEYIGILERQRDSLVKTLESRAALEMQSLNEAGREIDSLRAVVVEQNELVEAAAKTAFDSVTTIEESPYEHQYTALQKAAMVAANIRAALTKLGEQAETKDLG